MHSYKLSLKETTEGTAYSYIGCIIFKYKTIISFTYDIYKVEYKSGQTFDEVRTMCIMALILNVKPENSWNMR